MPEASPLARKLVKTTYDAMWEGIQQVKPGATLGISVQLFSIMLNHAATAWCASIAVTVSAVRCMKPAGAALWCAR